MKYAVRLGAGVIAGILVMIFMAGLLLSALLGGGGGCVPTSTIVATGASTSALLKSMDAEQLKIASLIISIGRSRGFSDKDIIVALMVGYQESKWRNVRFGDRDSLGIFQQRPSVKAWGTAAQIMNPVHAINAFYNALEKEDNRDTRTLLDLAESVQRPYVSRDGSVHAYLSKDHYFPGWEPLARAALAASTSTTTDTGTPPVSQVGTSGQITSTTLCGNDENVVLAGLPGGRLRVPVENGVIKSKFGMRFHPILRYMRLHNGVDFSKPCGTPVYAAAPGIVAKVGVQGSYGNYVQINHGSGLQTGYAHLQRYASGLSTNDTISTGQLIGYIGTTGRSTGCHLHFVVYKNGTPVDPEPYLKG